MISFFVLSAHPPPKHPTDELCGLNFGGKRDIGRGKRTNTSCHSNVLLAERKKVDLRRGFFYGLDLKNKTSWKDKKFVILFFRDDNCRSV